jgi:hypothetical protein
MEVESPESGKYYCNWDKDKKLYTLQLYFKERKMKNYSKKNGIIFLQHAQRVIMLERESRILEVASQT